jgi:hypothetical protein
VDSDVTNDWEVFTEKMRIYREEQAILFSYKTKVFEAEMKNIRTLCEDTTPLISGITTKIIKDTGAVYREDDDGFKVYDLDILNVQKNIDDDDKNSV